MKGVPLDSRSQDVYHQNYRYDNESDTDEEMSDNQDSGSSDDEDYKSTIGNISTKTSNQGKVKIKVQKDDKEDEVDGMDVFEKEMADEMALRLLQFQQEAMKDESKDGDNLMITDESSVVDEKEARGETKAEKSTNLADNPTKSTKENSAKSTEENSTMSAAEKLDQDKYDDIYFDSDDETDGKESKKEKQKFKTDDDLLYDPNLDDEDQRWMDDLRRTYQSPGSSSGLKNKKNDGLKPLPNSDAILNCPACFVVVCLDCQRHEIYKTQYRAMFVMNCTVKTDEVMKVPLKMKKKNKKSKVFTNPGDEFHPVRCDECRTEIGMYDKDEIYHFFNVVASHT